MNPRPLPRGDAPAISSPPSPVPPVALSIRAAGGSWAFGVSAALLLASYASLLVIPCAFQDDYALLASNLLHQPFWVLPAQGGRPLYGALLQLIASHVSTVAGLRWLRLLGLVAILGVAGMFFRTLRRHQVDALQAACLCALVCLMPLFQVFDSWAVTFAYPMAALLACVAGVRWERGGEGMNPSLSPRSCSASAPS